LLVVSASERAHDSSFPVFLNPVAANGSGAAIVAKPALMRCFSENEPLGLACESPSVEAFFIIQSSIESANS